MKLEKYLQLGTIVLLKDAKKRMMIIGYEAVTDESDGKTYDYIGCLYPEGVMESNKHLLFNHDQIEEIYFSGYTDIEDQEYKVNLKKLVNERNAQSLNFQNEEKNSSDVFSNIV